MLNKKEIKELLKRMSENDKDILIELINKERNIKTNNDFLLQLSTNYKCPHCGSNKVNKNGTAHKTIPQFICRNCHKTYTIRTNTIFYYSKKDINVWKDYIELFSQGLSLRKIVVEMDEKINLKTAFFWRHKILEIMKHFDNHDNLGGIIEADETFFEESQKGNKYIKDRKPRKRGYSSYTNTKKTKICLLTAN